MSTEGVMGSVNSTVRQATRAYNPNRGIRALFHSSTLLTPATGGGNTTLNVLEPAPVGSEVFYVTPRSYPSHMLPPPEIAPRLRMFGREAAPLVPAISGRARASLRYIKDKLGLQDFINKIVARTINEKKQDYESAFEHLLDHVEELSPDVLLVSPGYAPDMVAALEVLEKTKLPMVLWFMDSYYLDEDSMPQAEKLWNMTEHRFVISESMQEYFAGLFGGESQVLNNCVPFPESYPEPAPRTDDRLRIAYAGGLTEYYMGPLMDLFDELRGTSDRVTLDLYSPFDRDPRLENATDISWRHLPPIAMDKIVERLQEYDVLFLPSSFAPEFEVLARTGHSTKVADYLATGRCILGYGPEYADNLRYLQRHGIGEVVTSRSPGDLRKAVLSLADEPQRRRELGERAYYFGREHRDKAKYSARVWQALFDAAKRAPVDTGDQGAGRSAGRAAL